MLKDLRGRADDVGENLNEEIVNIKKDIETINKNQSEMITIPEIKNSLGGINSRLDEADDWISELEDKMTVSTQRDNEKEKRLRRNTKSKEPMG